MASQFTLAPKYIMLYNEANVRAEGTRTPREGQTWH